MENNKVIYGGETLIDLSQDTVIAEKMYKGITAHAANGSIITGNAEVTVENTKLIMPDGFIGAVTTTTSNNETTIEGAIIASKTITENGTYNASTDGVNGYDPVIVNVGGGSANVWGEITGTLSNQRDLVEALSTKANIADLGSLATKNNISWSSDITNIPSTFTPSSHNHTTSEITNFPTLGTMSGKDDAPSDGNKYARKNGDWVTITEGGSGASSWGDIGGTLSNQTDLIEALSTKANVADLGDLSSMSTISYTSNYITNKPTLGTLASMSSISYTSDYITNKPTLGNLASKNSVSYSTEVTDKPSLGALSSLNNIDYTSNKLTNKPILGALASKNSVSYSTEVTDKPTLGGMAAIDDAPSDGKEYIRKNGAWSEVTSNTSETVSNSTSWGSITGTLSNQTDLKNALDSKVESSSLSTLAFKDKVNWNTDIDNIPSTFSPSSHNHTTSEITNFPNLGNLSSLDSISYTSNYITNKPTLGDLASLNTISYTSNYITNKPTLGNLAALDSISYTSNYITNKPTLGSLAELSSISYTSNYITNKPTLGTMAAKDDAASDNGYYVRRNGSWTTLPVYTGSVT